MSRLTQTTPILLAEHDPDEVYLVRRALRETDTRNPLQVVNNAQNAIDYLAGNGDFADRVAYPFPALFLLSLGMPGGAGVDVLKWLRERPDVPGRLPVVVFSSADLPDEIQSAFAMDVQVCILKPLGYPELRERLRIIKEYWLDYEI